MKVLFICNQNQNRSKTAELIFKDKFESRTAGLYNETPVTKEQILPGTGLLAFRMTCNVLELSFYLKIMSLYYF